MVDQQVDALLGAFPGVFITAISPGSGECLAAFPSIGPAAANLGDFLFWNRLFWRQDVTFARNVQAIVDEDSWY